MALDVAVVAVAAFTHLWRLDLSQFFDDQAILLAMARDLLDGHGLPLVGMYFQVGVHQPPLVVYLLALLWAATRSELGVTAVVATLGVLSVAICYRLCREQWGRAAALAAGLLYAVNPAALVYERKIWQPDLVPLCSSLVLWGCLRLLRRADGRALATALATFGAMAQLHLAALAQAPALLFALVASWRHLRLRGALLGLGLVALSLAPYLVYQARHGFEAFGAMAAYSHLAGGWDLVAVKALALMSAGHAYPGELHLDLGAAVVPFHLGPTGWLELVLVVGGMLLLACIAAGAASLSRPVPSPPASSGGISAGAARARPGVLASASSPTRGTSRVGAFTRPPSYSGTGRDAGTAVLVLGETAQNDERGWRARVAALLILAWIALPALAALRHPLGVYPRYLVAAFPAPWIAAGVLAQWAWDAVGRARAVRLAPAVAAAVVALAQVVSFIAAMSRAALVGPWEGYGPGLGYSRQVALAAARAAQDGSPVYVAAGDDFTSVFALLLRPVPQAKQFDGANTLVLPSATHPATVYVVQEDGGPAAEFLTRHFARYRLARVPTPAGRDVYRVYRLPAAARADAEQAADFRPLEVEAAGVLRLDGYRLSSRLHPGDRLDAILRWHVERDPNNLPAEVTQFGHVVDVNWRTWGGQDFPGFRRRGWAMGDEVLTWFLPTVDPHAPRGQYWLATGMYSSYSAGDTRPLPLRDGEGHDLGGVVRLGPFTVASAVERPVAEPPRALLGRSIGWLGASAAVTSAAGERRVEVRLRWLALAPTERDYTVFVHLLDDTGKLVAQHDGPPQAGAYPTSAWQPGEEVDDLHALPIAGLAPGAYHLIAGMYDPATQQRLPVYEPHPPESNPSTNRTWIDLGELTALDSAVSDSPSLSLR